MPPIRKRTELSRGLAVTRAHITALRIHNHEVATSNDEMRTLLASICPQVNELSTAPADNTVIDLGTTAAFTPGGARTGYYLVPAAWLVTGNAAA